MGGGARQQGPDNFAQLYGGYIAPSSTVADMNIVVSQWNTKNNSRYMSPQFNMRGLDKFFGIGNQPKARTMLRSVPVPQIGDNNGIVVGADWGSPSGGSAVGGGVGSSGFSPDSGDTHGIEIGLSGYIILLWCST